ncbi:MAG TPA: glycosyltransferase [Cyclobacteriaceae bacterium]|nr:glycosyltransferase [Cyclobacteriaceae bacterium]
MTDHPLVSVICLCYNHREFVEEAIESVLGQTYPNVEIIVVDDASVDGSVDVIVSLLSRYPHVKFFKNEENMGNCKSFNLALENASGDFVIDLSADDILLPHRVEAGIKKLTTSGDEYGVQFSDAILVNEMGQEIGLHSDRFPHDTVPTGYIYKEIVSRYFICSPTMMMRRGLLQQLGGYDETLAYEDFDFWVRSSRISKYTYIPEPLIKRRVLARSMVNDQFKKGSKQLVSTFRVCEKIKQLNQTSEDQKAWRGRVWYEIRVCFRLMDFALAFRYLKLLIR